MIKKLENEEVGLIVGRGAPMCHVIETLRDTLTAGSMVFCMAQEGTFAVINKLGDRYNWGQTKRKVYTKTFCTAASVGVTQAISHGLEWLSGVDCN